MSQKKKCAATVIYTINVEFEVHEDTSESMMAVIAEEKAADKLGGPGPDNTEIEDLEFWYEEEQ